MNRREPTSTSAAVATELDRFGTAQGLDLEAVSDACDRLGRGAVTLGLRPLWAKAPSFAGPAVTMEVVCGGFPASSGHHLGVDAIERATPGDVIVIDHRGRVDAAAWGGLLTEAAKAQGVRGVVVDGAARDVHEAEAAGLPLYGVAPVSRTARGRVVQRSVNQPIHFRGIVIMPGDVVFVSPGGVVAVPPGDVEEVLAGARQIKDKELAMREDLLGGMPLTSVLGQRYERMLDDGPAPPGIGGPAGRS